MFRLIRTVFAKEVLDHFRDRRALMSALIMGPLFGPILFTVVINLSVSRALDDEAKPLELPVIGAEFAPNLMRYLESENIVIQAPPESRAAAIDAIKRGELDAVLVISNDYGDQIAAGTPARIEVIADKSDEQAYRQARRAADALGAYSQEVAVMRLIARGVNTSIMRPLNVDLIDVSTPSGRSAMLLGMLSYFFIFAMLMGGMSLAIDATAGERERGSLEPLLSLPVSRDQLILGKIAAACLFMLLSLFLSLSAFSVALNFLPLERLGMTPNFGPSVVVTAFFVMAPFVLLGASLMTLVASFTKSFKEAQTWLSIVLLAPTMPILIVSLLNVRTATNLMFVPSLSQHLLLVDLLKNEPVVPLHVAISVCSTLTIGVIVAWLCARLYRREGLLG